jgi:monofunctional biosynthetic peptidoglycan transglycosylase
MPVDKPQLVERGRALSLREPPLRAILADRARSCLAIALTAGTRVLLVAIAMPAALVAALLLLFRFADPPTSAYMLGQRLAGTPITQTWVPLDRVSPHLVRAVILSEDGQFCSHRGIDFRELELALEQAEREGGEVRGASTISMQVSKNLFLWPSKSYVRKGLELVITVAMEVAWPKRRILEVYLNIAEWGPGVFGAEAAARYHFGKPASRLGEREAALLAVALPNPLERIAGSPGPGTRRLAQTVETRMKAAGRRASCVLDGDGP